MRRFLMFPLTRIAIAAIVLIAPFVAIQLGLQAAGVDLPSVLDSALIVGTSVLALFVLARFVERRSLADVGLGLRNAGRDLALGLGFGAALMAVTMSVLAAAGWYRVEGFAGGLTWAAGAFVSTFLFATFEEIAFRGIVFRVFEEGTGTVLALIISAAIFGLAHAQNPAATWFSSGAIALEAGILLGAAYVLTRTLWFAIGIHAGWNFFLGPIFGAAVSGEQTRSVLVTRLQGPELWTGGAFGPEASIVTVMLCTAAGVAILWAAVRRGRIWPMRGEARRAYAAGGSAAAGDGARR